MPLSIPTPPPECAKAFSKDLPAFLTPGYSETFVGTPPQIPSTVDVGLGSGPVYGPPTIPAALPAFVLNLHAAADKTAVFSPTPSGWSFFAGGAQGKTILGRMVERRHAWKLVGINYGDLVSATLDAILNLLSTPPVQTSSQNYEIRLLGVPGLNLQYFWLATPNAAADLIVRAPQAVTSPTPPIHVSPPYEIPNFLAEIQPLAAGLLSMPAKSGA